MTRKQRTKWPNAAPPSSSNSSAKPRMPGFENNSKKQRASSNVTRLGRFDLAHKRSAGKGVLSWKS